MFPLYLALGIGRSLEFISKRTFSFYEIAFLIESFHLIFSSKLLLGFHLIVIDYLKWDRVRVVCLNRKKQIPTFGLHILNAHGSSLISLPLFCVAVFINFLLGLVSFYFFS